MAHKSHTHTHIHTYYSRIRKHLHTQIYKKKELKPLHIEPRKPSSTPHTKTQLSLNLLSIHKKNAFAIHYTKNTQKPHIFFARTQKHSATPAFRHIDE